jgi:cyclopropane-fatty-acyl-phospholipid synthase
MKHAQVRDIPTFSSLTEPRSSNAVDRWALARIQGAVRSAPVRFVLWDGFAIGSEVHRTIATVVIKNRPALFRWLWDPDLNFGEAYMFGAVDVHGDLTGMLEAVYRGQRNQQPVRRRFWPRANDLRAARQNVHQHYDLGNDFYALWLDRQLVYTCAFYPAPSATLEEAQIAKMDRVCRKLRLTPGDRVVEAGCGWGSLALFMAQMYGVSVDAFNLSSEQIAFARRLAKASGLEDRVRFIEDDYRNIRGTYDAFVSVGMLEHVGLPDYRTLGEVIGRSLTSAGRGLLHFIGRNRQAPLNAWIRKRIFPGAYPPTLREVFDRVLEPQDLSVLDVENLRLHYAKTLQHWRERFEASADQIARTFDDPFVRAWRLYLAGSQAAFTTGWLQLFQVTFARGASNNIPWIRLQDGGPDHEYGDGDL